MDNQNQSLRHKGDIIFLVVILGVIFCVFAICAGLVSLLSIGYFNSQSAHPIAIIPATPTPGPCPPIPSDWDLKIEDRFDNNFNHWPIGQKDSDYGTKMREITDGKYRIHAVASKSVNSYFYPSMEYKVYDFYLAADVRQLEGQLSGLYGLVYRRNPDDDRYFFGILDTQMFTLRQKFMNEWHTLIPPTYSPAVRPGEANRLVVIANGSSFTFCINQTLIAEIENADITLGEAGFSYSLFNEGDEATFEFDNFQLYVPPSSE